MRLRCHATRGVKRPCEGAETVRVATKELGGGGPEPKGGLRAEGP